MRRPLVWMIVGALAVWGCTMAVHKARADDIAGPKWKIVIVLANTKTNDVIKLTYGSQAEGPHWYATEVECQTARQGGDKKLAEGLAKLLEQLKKDKAPVNVETGCVTDNSI